ncbi:MAG: L-rhamnose catabolism isomerase [Gammaproteobacteria bacterium]|nr:L-rhamnose catabolism isomerase [Gammaproteobacteria bacterium]
MQTPIDASLIELENSSHRQNLAEDYESLGIRLARRNINIDQIKQQVGTFNVAIPTWGVATGGTRFARFPNPGDPRDLYEKLEDCAVIQQLGQSTPALSPHFPWDDVSDYNELRERANAFGLSFDAVNSNTFADQQGQLSYKYGSLTHTNPAVRSQAVQHNLECIEKGIQLGSKALTVWISDGSNFPGQQDFTTSLDRYLESMHKIYAQLPDDWQLFIEHKLYEPAFYATVIQDWGSNYLCAQELGDKAKCLVDLGHHAPTVNIEMIVARLIHFEKLAGFHFNDSKYGDDDLDSGSIQPFQLFLIFNELVAAELRNQPGFSPSYMLDQSHNVTDPIESLINSAGNLRKAYCQALLVDRSQLASAQNDNDVLLAHNILKQAFETDVEPIVAGVRFDFGGAINPIETFRASRYRLRKANERPQQLASGSGIV